MKRILDNRSETRNNFFIPDQKSWKIYLKYIMQMLFLCLDWSFHWFHLFSLYFLCELLVISLPIMPIMWAPKLWPTCKWLRILSNKLCNIKQNRSYKPTQCNWLMSRPRSNMSTNSLASIFDICVNRGITEKYSPNEYWPQSMITVESWKKLLKSALA